MHRLSSIAAASALIALALTALALGCFEEPPARTASAEVSAPGAARSHEAASSSGAEPAHGTARAIGEGCVACHAPIVRSYRVTGMARALGSIEKDEATALAGLEEVADGTTGFRYRFEQYPRGARIVETWRSPEGGSAAGITRSAELAFAIGAGLFDRSYAALVGSLVWFAPLEVVEREGSGHAALAPGHMIRPGTRFTSPITEECLTCHTDALQPRTYPLNLRPDPKAWQPAGIGCAACHTRGEAHARWRESELAGATPSESDPIGTPRSRPSAIGPIESVSTCARCHLQGDASILLEPGARGLLAPGGDLLERRAVFVAAEPTDEIGFVSHVERLVLSRCFTASLERGAGALSCVTCHDPHRSVFEPKERDAVRARCLACHPAGEESSASAHACALPAKERAGMDCAQCHMRSTGVFDVADVAIHDHFIRAKPGSPSPPRSLRTKEALDAKLAVFSWPGRPKPAYADDPGLWMIAYASYGRPDLALAWAQKPAAAKAQQLASYHHLRGSILERAGRAEEALTAYERALALDPEYAESANNLGALLGQRKQPQAGIQLLDDLIEEHPFAEGALRNRALLAHQVGDYERFARDFEAAHRILPQAPLARALAQHWQQRGRPDLAESWGREARTLDPTQP